MKPLDRNTGILRHIVTYCEQIEQTVERFGDSAEIFAADPIYRNAAALCILYPAGLGSFACAQDRYAKNKTEKMF